MALTPKQKLCNVDSGRFADIIESLSIDDLCFECGEFNEDKVNRYRCACLGSCIGVTLSTRLKKYLIEKFDWYEFFSGDQWTPEQIQKIKNRQLINQGKINGINS